MDEALQLAQEAELDLVQIADGDPIVCKIMEYYGNQHWCNCFCGLDWRK